MRAFSWGKEPLESDHFDWYGSVAGFFPGHSEQERALRMLSALVSILPETKTSPLKINGWTMKFLFGARQNLSFRECNYHRETFRPHILLQNDHLKCWDQNHPNIWMFYGLCRPIPLLTLQNSNPPQNSVHMIFCKGRFSYTSTDCNQKPLHSPQTHPTRFSVFQTSPLWK